MDIFPILGDILLRCVNALNSVHVFGTTLWMWMLGMMVLSIAVKVIHLMFGTGSNDKGDKK